MQVQEFAYPLNHPSSDLRRAPFYDDALWHNELRPGERPRMTGPYVVRRALAKDLYDIHELVVQLHDHHKENGIVCDDPKPPFDPERPMFYYRNISDGKFSINVKDVVPTYKLLSLDDIQRFMRHGWVYQARCNGHMRALMIYQMVLDNPDPRSFFYLNSKMVILHHLYVYPGWRHMGIGSMLRSCLPPKP